MPSKNGSRKPRRSASSSSTVHRKKAKKHGSKTESRRRGRSCSSSSSDVSRQSASSSASNRTQSRHRSRSPRRSKKLKPKKRSKSRGKPVDNGRKPFESSAKLPPESAKTPQVAGKEATNGAPGGEKKKFDLGSILELQKKLDEDKDRLELFVIKAKREHDDKRESKEKAEQREREYYKAELGMPCGPGNKFLLEAELGKGVFSTVYQARDVGHQGKDVAIKFVRSDPMCRRATEKEVKLMRMLRNKASVSDPEGSRCLLGLGSVEMFEQEGHLAVVLQLMKCDLRTGLRKYGQGHGLPLPFVHTFARDIFLALRALRSIKVVHTDLKPDNLLISLDRTSVKLSDFGSAMDTAQAGQVRTDYLQPRFYRAPEVILGQPYSTQIDMWSAGATLFELATDRVLFRAESNNSMTHAMLKICGPFSKTLATTGKFASKHFTDSGEFLLKDKGDLSVETLAMSSFAKPSPSLLRMLEESAAKQRKALGKEGGVDANTKASLRHLADLVTKCCLPDPAERAAPKVALAHAFVLKADKAQVAKAFG